METDIAIIGAGAAGLAAAIFAGHASRESRLCVVLLEGARKPGAKILVSGGGRCNVTNERVSPEDFWGGPRPAIRSVLRAFDEKRTLEWMRAMGVELKLEPTGKYFPETDKARTVLDALLRETGRSGVRLLSGIRVTGIAPRAEGGFAIETGNKLGTVTARRVILASGGLSLPKSGSDGWGIAAARRLGHSIVPAVPALVPLVLEKGPEPGGRFEELSGVTLEARLGLFGESGKKLQECEGSLLFTHFGISGPAALDLSRHLMRARGENPETDFRVCLSHPGFHSPAEADAWLREETQRHPRKSPAGALGALFPERLARVLAGEGGRLGDLSRAGRLRLAECLARLPLIVSGPRGWAFAETTAGGVDLREVDTRTMESRVVPELHLCGEMLDVDGRIGGFNFQWAWASGHLAGVAAARALANSNQAAGGD